MIVAEDRITNEVVRFLVIDAYAKLGVVQYGFLAGYWQKHMVHRIILIL